MRLGWGLEFYKPLSAQQLATEKKASEPALIGVVQQIRFGKRTFKRSSFSMRKNTKVEQILYSKIYFRELLNKYRHRYSTCKTDCHHVHLFISIFQVHLRLQLRFRGAVEAPLPAPDRPDLRPRGGAQLRRQPRHPGIVPRELKVG